GGLGNEHVLNRIADAMKLRLPNGYQPVLRRLIQDHELYLRTTNESLADGYLGVISNATSPFYRQHFATTIDFLAAITNAQMNVPDEMVDLMIHRAGIDRFDVATQQKIWTKLFYSPDFQRTMMSQDPLRIAALSGFLDRAFLDSGSKFRNSANDNDLMLAVDVRFSYSLATQGLVPYSTPSEPFERYAIKTIHEILKQMGTDAKLDATIIERTGASSESLVIACHDFIPTPHSAIQFARDIRAKYDSIARVDVPAANEYAKRIIELFGVRNTTFAVPHMTYQRIGAKYIFIDEAEKYYDIWKNARTAEFEARIDTLATMLNGQINTLGQRLVTLREKDEGILKQNKEIFFKGGYVGIIKTPFLDIQQNIVNATDRMDALKRITIPVVNPGANYNDVKEFIEKYDILNGAANINRGDDDMASYIKMFWLQTLETQAEMNGKDYLQYTSEMIMNYTTNGQPVGKSIWAQYGLTLDAALKAQYLNESEIAALPIKQYFDMLNTSQLTEIRFNAGNPLNSQIFRQMESNIFAAAPSLLSSTLTVYGRFADFFSNYTNVANQLIASATNPQQQQQQAIDSVMKTISHIGNYTFNEAQKEQIQVIFNDAIVESLYRCNKLVLDDLEKIRIQFDKVRQSNINLKDAQNKLLGGVGAAWGNALNFTPKNITEIKKFINFLSQSFHAHVHDVQIFNHQQEVLWNSTSKTITKDVYNKIVNIMTEYEGIGAANISLIDSLIKPINTSVHQWYDALTSVNSITWLDLDLYIEDMDWSDQLIFNATFTNEDEEKLFARAAELAQTLDKIKNTKNAMTQSDVYWDGLGIPWNRQALIVKAEILVEVAQKYVAGNNSRLINANNNILTPGSRNQNLIKIEQFWKSRPIHDIDIFRKTHFVGQLKEQLAPPELFGSELNIEFDEKATENYTSLRWLTDKRVFDTSLAAPYF